MVFHPSRLLALALLQRRRSADVERLRVIIRSGAGYEGVFVLELLGGLPRARHGCRVPHRDAPHYRSPPVAPGRACPSDPRTREALQDSPAHTDRTGGEEMA